MERSDRMGRRNRTIALAIIGAFALFGALAWTLLRVSVQMPQTRADEVSAIPLGGQVIVVGQVRAIKGNVLTFEILHGQKYEKRSGAVYQAERGDERIVMGSDTDIKVGAIAQFEGTKQTNQLVKLEQIVILTPFIEGPPGQ